MSARDAVWEFYMEMKKKRQRFFKASDVTAFVRGLTQRSYSPETAMRRLRELREDGEFLYRREGSRFTWVW